MKNGSKLKNVATNALKQRVQIPLHPTSGHNQYTYMSTSRSFQPVRPFENNPNILKSNIIQPSPLKLIPSTHMNSKSLHSILMDHIMENTQNLNDYG